MLINFHNENIGIDMITRGSVEYLTILARLRTAIEKNGYQYKDVANYLKMSQSSVTYYLTGIRPFPLDRFLSVCLFAGADPHVICGDFSSSEKITKESEGGTPSKRRA